MHPVGTVGGLQIILLHLILILILILVHFILLLNAVVVLDGIILFVRTDVKIILSILLHFLPPLVFNCLAPCFRGSFGTSWYACALR